nr:MAG TPA: hypothetical protein [Caudoviricetes sp.]
MKQDFGTVFSFRRISSKFYFCQIFYEKKIFFTSSH